MKLLAVALLIACLANSSLLDGCKCTAPAPDETTHQGGNEVITFREKKIYKSIHGVVHDANGEPVAGVLVEVFDHPEWILLDYPASEVKQRRIEACKTGDDGSFCFEHIPSGKYELRASKDATWNPSHVYIVVNRRSRKSMDESIVLRLKVGT